MTGKYVSVELNGKRTCSHCGEIKSTEEFHPGRCECITCYNIKRRENKTSKRSTDFIGNMKRRGEEDPQFKHQDWVNCVIFFGGTCCYCGATPRKGKRLTRDHLQSIRQGGRTTPHNIVPACESCNTSKGPKEWREWFMAQSFFSQERMNRIFQWRRIMRVVGGSGEEEGDE